MNSWTKLTEALSALPIIEQLNDEKRQLDAIRPLSEEVEGRVMQKIKLDWNYHSNAIEGNKLTFGETYTFLMYGLTAKGKPLKDHLDIKGHNEAINFLISVVKDNADLREGDIRDLHKMVLVEPYKSPAKTHDGQKIEKTILIGEYKKLPNSVETPTGEMHYYATPEETPILMDELVQWYNEARKNPKIHPSVLAAFFHHRFVAIHPFDDGNGRVARILMNLILMQKGYPPAVVKLKERTDYYAALGQADKNEYLPLMEFVAETLLESLSLYLKAARGESIEEEADIDKEIALFKQEFSISKGNHSYSKSNEVIKQVIFEVVQPFIRKIDYKFLALDTLFLNRTNTIWLQDSPRDSNYYPRFVNIKLDNIIELKEIKNGKNWWEDYLNGIMIRFIWEDFSMTKKKLAFGFKIEFELGQVGFKVICKFEHEIESHVVGSGYYGAKLDTKQENEWIAKILRLIMNEIKKRQLEV